MEPSVFISTAIVVLLLVALVLLVRRLQLTERAFTASAEWEQLCTQLDVGVGFCDENLNLRRANPAFFGMFVRGRQPMKPGNATMPVDEWLGRFGAGHPLQNMLLRTLSGTESLSGHVRLDEGGESCLVRVHRVNLDNGRLLLTLVATRIRHRIEAGEFTMISGGLDDAGARMRDERHGERRKQERLKDAVIVRVAHDLRNSLNAAMGWLHLIEADKIPKEEIGGAVGRIRNSLLRQNGLIGELRKLADPVMPVSQMNSANDRSIAR